MMTVFQANLYDWEDTYTIGIFSNEFEARKALANALKQYRSYLRMIYDHGSEFRRGRVLQPSLIAREVGQSYIPQWWSTVDKIGPAYGEPV